MFCFSVAFVALFSYLHAYGMPCPSHPLSPSKASPGNFPMELGSCTHDSGKPHLLRCVQERDRCWNALKHTVRNA